MTAILLAALRVIEAGLDRVDAARTRVEMRKFLKENPAVRFKPDGF